jgi:hypothetical protein
MSHQAYGSHEFLGVYTFASLPFTNHSVSRRLLILYCAASLCEEQQLAEEDSAC